jgi:hypothetical protein
MFFMSAASIYFCATVRDTRRLEKRVQRYAAGELSQEDKENVRDLEIAAFGDHGFNKFGNLRARHGEGMPSAVSV